MPSAGFTLVRVLALAAIIMLAGAFGPSLLAPRPKATASIQHVLLRHAKERGAGGNVAAGEVRPGLFLAHIARTAMAGPGAHSGGSDHVQADR